MILRRGQETRVLLVHLACVFPKYRAQSGLLETGRIREQGDGENIFDTLRGLGKWNTEMLVFILAPQLWGFCYFSFFEYSSRGSPACFQAFPFFSYRHECTSGPTAKSLLGDGLSCPPLPVHLPEQSSDAVFPSSRVPQVFPWLPAHSPCPRPMTQPPVPAPPSFWALSYNRTKCLTSARACITPCFCVFTHKVALSPAPNSISSLLGTLFLSPSPGWR